MSDLESSVVWARRWMRSPGSLVERNDFIPKRWHIQNPAAGGSGTYCGVNVVRFYSDRAVAPVDRPPEGDVCGKCIKQRALGRVLPQGGGASHRRG